MFPSSFLAGEYVLIGPSNVVCALVQTHSVRYRCRSCRSCFDRVSCSCALQNCSLSMSMVSIRDNSGQLSMSMDIRDNSGQVSMSTDSIRDNNNQLSTSMASILKSIS